ncbi:hypothetical protein Hanom_Chr15g01345321 [Helianthus anomalus]
MCKLLKRSTQAYFQLKQQSNTPTYVSPILTHFQIRLSDRPEIDVPCHTSVLQIWRLSPPI